MKCEDELVADEQSEPIDLRIEVERLVMDRPVSVLLGVLSEFCAACEAQIRAYGIDLAVRNRVPRTPAVAKDLAWNKQRAAAYRKAAKMLDAAKRELAPFEHGWDTDEDEGLAQEEHPN